MMSDEEYQKMANDLLDIRLEDIDFSSIVEKNTISSSEGYNDARRLLDKISVISEEFSNTGTDFLSVVGEDKLTIKVFKETYTEHECKAFYDRAEFLSSIDRRDGRMHAALCRVYGIGTKATTATPNEAINLKPNFTYRFYIRAILYLKSGCSRYQQLRVRTALTSSVYKRYDGIGYNDDSCIVSQSLFNDGIRLFYGYGLGRPGLRDPYPKLEIDERFWDSTKLIRVGMERIIEASKKEYFKADLYIAICLIEGYILKKDESLGHAFLRRALRKYKPSQVYLNQLGLSDDFIQESSSYEVKISRFFQSSPNFKEKYRFPDTTYFRNEIYHNTNNTNNTNNSKSDITQDLDSILGNDVTSDVEMMDFGDTHYFPLDHALEDVNPKDLFNVLVMNSSQGDDISTNIKDTFKINPGVSLRYLGLSDHTLNNDDLNGANNTGATRIQCDTEHNIKLESKNNISSNHVDRYKKHGENTIALKTRTVGASKKIKSELYLPESIDLSVIEGMCYVVAGRIERSVSYSPNPVCYLNEADANVARNKFLAVLVVSKGQYQSTINIVSGIKNSQFAILVVSQYNNNISSSSVLWNSQPKAIMPGVRRMVAMQTMINLKPNLPNLKFVGIEDDNVAVNNKINGASWANCLKELAEHKDAVLIVRQEQNPKRKIELCNLEKALVKKTGFKSGKSLFMNMSALNAISDTFKDIPVEVFLPINSNLIWEDCYLVYLLKWRCKELSVCTHGYFKRSSNGRGLAQKNMGNQEDNDKYSPWYNLDLNLDYIDDDDKLLHKEIADYISKEAESTRKKAHPKKRTREPNYNPNAKKLSLREYQKILIDDVMRNLNEEKKCAAIVLPTGAGKTLVLQHVMSKLINRLNEETSSSPSTMNKVLWLSPGLTLNQQSLESLGESGLQLSRQVDFTNYQQLTSNFDFKNYSILIIDEAHHAICESIKSIIKKFKDKGGYIIGASATLFRTKKDETTELHNIFGNNIIYGPTAQKLTELGFLTPAVFYTKNRPFSSEQNCDYNDSDFMTTDEDSGFEMARDSDSEMAGDSDSEMAEDSDSEMAAGLEHTTSSSSFKLDFYKYLEIDKILGANFIKGKRGIIFCSTQNEAKALCELINRDWHEEQQQKKKLRVKYQNSMETLSEDQSSKDQQNPIATCVLGETSREERESIFSQFHSNSSKLSILVTCAALTEGFSESLLEWTIIASHTKSVLPITQIIGRGLRLGKDDNGVHEEAKSCFRVFFLHNVEKEIIHNFYPDIQIEEAKQDGFIMNFDILGTEERPTIIIDKSHEEHKNGNQIAGYTQYLPNFSSNDKQRNSMRDQQHVYRDRFFPTKRRKTNESNEYIPIGLNPICRGYNMLNMNNPITEQVVTKQNAKRYGK